MRTISGLEALLPIDNEETFDAGMMMKRDVNPDGMYADMASIAHFPAGGRAGSAAATC